MGNGIVPGHSDRGYGDYQQFIILFSFNFRGPLQSWTGTPPPWIPLDMDMQSAMDTAGSWPHNYWTRSLILLLTKIHTASRSLIPPARQVTTRGGLYTDRTRGLDPIRGHRPHKNPVHRLHTGTGLYTWIQTTHRPHKNTVHRPHTGLNTDHRKYLSNSHGDISRQVEGRRWFGGSSTSSSGMGGSCMISVCFFRPGTTLCLYLQASVLW